MKTTTIAEKKPNANPREVITRAVVHLLQHMVPRPTTDAQIVDLAYTIFEGLQAQIVELYNERIMREVLYAPLEAAIGTQKPEAVIDVLLSGEGFAVLSRLRALRNEAKTASDSTIATATATATATVSASESAPVPAQAQAQPVTTVTGE